MKQLLLCTIGLAKEFTFLVKPEVGDVFNKLQKKCAGPGLEN